MSNRRAARKTPHCFVSRSITVIAIRHGSFLIGFLILVSCFAVKPSFATDHSLGPGGPPLVYRIDEASIRLTRYFGSRASPPKRAVLSGGGGAILDQDGKRAPLSYPQRNFLVHLNELYRIRFFELPSDYTTRYAVSPKDNKTVETVALPMPDIASTRICFAVGGYKKCVTFGEQGPCELKDIATQIYSEAGRFDEQRVR